MTIAEILAEATAILEGGKIPEPARESSLLLSLAIGRDRSFLIAHPEYELNRDEEQSCRDYVNRRAAREPYQYIAGKQEFYGLDFAVTRDVLIPRPETEMLAAGSVGILRKMRNPRFLEIGIGSGCIAVSILKSVPDAQAVGVDISDAAIAIASSNAAGHAVSDRFRLQNSDVFSHLLNEKFDLIVSNPPYVPAADLNGLQAEVRDHEPHKALSDGGDGLSIIRRIIDGAPEFLIDGGWLLIEIGFGQGGEVQEMLDADIWQSATIEPDFQGIPRMAVAQTARTFSASRRIYT